MMDAIPPSVSSPDPTTAVSHDRDTPPEGVMRDIELSSSAVTLDGPLLWLQPWFNITEVEYARRCKACLISYMCFNFSFLRKVEIPFIALHAALDDLLKRLEIAKWIHGETIDLSTSASSAKDPSQQPSGGQAISGNIGSFVTDNTGEATAFAGTMAPGEESSHFGLGILEGFCDIHHPVFTSLRQIWREPDLYAPFWINLMMSGALFKMYALHKHCLDGKNDVLSLSMLLYLWGLCASCTILMSGGIWASRTLLCGYENRISYIPLLSVCGYMQIPLLMFCKLTVWIYVIKLYVPWLSYLVRFLQYVTYVYFFASTSSTVSLYIPPAPDAEKDLRLKLISAVVTCAIQMYYFYWFQFYI
ncbi:hypothetical protein BaOVIS_009720 [Babesia ovis]|uniref:Uncharacterized protein n=1 Tax=Babesia ovis TaxID=5869 RepID=A0A9W5TB97_BABOV|nr:hypothetical protein BaOVIS_009720 [Babesia ovis]